MDKMTRRAMQYEVNCDAGYTVLICGRVWTLSDIQTGRRCIDKHEKFGWTIESIRTAREMRSSKLGSTMDYDEVRINITNKGVYIRREWKIQGRERMEVKSQARAHGKR